MEGDIQLHLDIIEQKLSTRRQLVDEDAPFASMHRIQNQKEDILLVTKTALPEYYQMNQKEVMYTNTLNSWKTSVTRFIQGLSQQDQLDLQKLIVYKKKAEDVYHISESQ